MKRKAISAGIADDNKFITIYSGMDLTPFLHVRGDIPGKKRELGINEGEKVIGKIGRFFPLKGHKYLIQAAPEVVKVFPNVKFLFVGDGILKERLQSEIEQLGLRDKFIFAGLVGREDIPLLISVMDILVHTSLREGLARVLPQAIACGKPIVSFDVDGAGEVVIPGETGFIVPPEDVNALSQAILNTLSDVGGLGQSGRKLVDPAFSTETMVDRIDNLYCGLLDNCEGKNAV
jgi:glycosyltransferase involved in cell wall biosynthesis